MGGVVGKDTVPNVKEYTPPTSEFKTMVFRKRKLSDSSLERILHDPLIHSAFRDFMNRTGGDRVLLFWLEVESFQELPLADAQAKLGKAERIYRHYVGQDVLPEDHVIMEADRVDIATLLKIKVGADGKEVLGEANVEVVNKAFNAASMKAFQVLKFEHMANFLVSKEFIELDSHKEYFDSVQDAADKAAAVMDDMGVAYIISHPVGVFHFTHFLQMDEQIVSLDSTVSRGLGMDLMNVYHEIDDFNSCPSDGNHRFERLTRIVKHFGHIKCLPTFANMVETFNPTGHHGHELREKIAVPGYFDEVCKELCQFLDKHYLAAFKKTSDYGGMSSCISAGEGFEHDDQKSLIASSFRKNKTAANVDQLKKFRDARNFSSSQQVEDSLGSLELVLADPLGRLFFKRHCIRHFIEEHVGRRLILFWIEVENFRMERFSSPSVGTMIMPKEGEEEISLRARRAEHMMRKYIESDSRLEVNIDTKLREACIARVKANKDVTIFDDVQKEVFKLLVENSWGPFKDSPAYKVLLSKSKTKRQHKSICMVAPKKLPSKIAE